MSKQRRRRSPRRRLSELWWRQLVKSARERGEDLTGPDGLLKVITKTVLETVPFRSIL